MCVRMQEIPFCFSKLKFMDAGCVAILSFSCCLHSADCDVNTRQQGHKPGFQANMQGGGIHYTL